MITVTYWKLARSFQRMVYKAIQNGRSTDPFYEEHMTAQGWKQISKMEYDNKNKQMALEI